ncbi:pyridoxamine 5'-phosphate oxidase family protein [Thiolinea disciformis]|uniref:pyridoxamine 5'-phosphate oxidase family protein n=1 Tax=Thiolinea disciformis TaxID=125614 RepID=UPI00036F462A|nr:pyridoxamine 5'-phosphate oxidase family protein [Thiolinea disciformis]
MSNSHHEALSQRATIKQSPKRADYNRETLYHIIDEAPIAVVAVSIDAQPVALPMMVARLRDCIYLHGSRASRLIKHLSAANPVCVTFAHLDGIVVARSGMHCSANYRSAVVHGVGRLIEGEEKARYLMDITYAIIPGSHGDYRELQANELKATSLIEIPLLEFACKIRTGGPIDDQEDVNLPYWAGVIPLQRIYGEPISSADLQEHISVPAYAANFKRNV